MRALGFIFRYQKSTLQCPRKSVSRRVWTLLVRRSSENKSIVQERQRNPKVEIRNRSIANVDINLDQVMPEDNIRLRDREHYDEDDVFEVGVVKEIRKIAHCQDIT